MSEPEAPKPDGKTISMPLRLDNPVPRIFTDYCVCSINDDQAQLTFAVRQTVLGDDGNEAMIPVPQVVCHMTVHQFLKTADLFERQAAKFRAELEKIDPSALKEKYLAPTKR
jgi:hypothetical protein